MNTASFEKRIAAIEARAVACPIVLTMTDGSTRQIAGSRKHFFRLAGLLNNEAESPLARELDWIRNAVAIHEHGGAFGLLQAILQGPNTEDETGETL